MPSQNYLSPDDAQKLGAYWAKDVSRDLMDKRHYSVPYLRGEVQELVDAVKERSWPHTKEEIGDVAFGAQMIAHQRTGLNFPMVGADAVIKKFYDRVEVYKKMFADRGVPFHVDHLAGGSNYQKPEKIVKAFASAGHPMSIEEAEQARASALKQLPHIKVADHVQDRRAERAPLVTPRYVEAVRKAAKRLQVPEGSYHFPLMAGAHGTAGIGVFRVIDGKLTMTTILPRTAKRPGTPLQAAQLFPQMAESDVKTGADYDPEEYREKLRPQQWSGLKRRFERYKRDLKNDGVYTGTYHTRITIPKSELLEDHIRALGFLPDAGIPEKGQDRFQTYRHPDHNFHIHSHPGVWTMHEDEHAAVKMKLHNAQTLGQKVKAVFGGVPHLVTEGVPGAAIYLKNQAAQLLSGEQRTMLDSIKEEREMLGLKTKTSELQTQLQPHQQRVVDRMRDPDQTGLVLNWGLGSGKTLGAIATADALKMPADVVVPAALRENFRKEIAKHVVGGQLPGTDISSLEGVARGGVRLTHPLLVVDEAHRARNPTKTQTALKYAPADKRLILTGSLMYNHPADMAAPINMAAGRQVLPTTQKDFEQQYVSATRTEPGFIDRVFRDKKPEMRIGVNPHHARELQEILDKYVDYHAGNTGNMPTRIDETVKVPLKGEQLKLYNTLYNAAPPWVRNAVKNDLAPDKKDTSRMMSFLTGPRQVATSNHSFLDDKAKFQSTKIDAAFGKLQEMLNANERAKAVVYSNFLSAGIEPYKRKLEAARIPYGEFTGAMPHSKRDQLVRDYNDGKLRALLLSSAGGEGLDLKGTRLMQILEPHWNEEKLKQVIGRGIRYKSHDDLPEDERNVRVQRFISTMPKGNFLERMFSTPDQSVDEYLANRSAEKEQLNAAFRKLLPHNA